MFRIGDRIVYGGMGVCTVQDICVPDFMKKPRQCYILKPHYIANAKVYAPVKENPVKMRRLLTPAEARELIDQIPDTDGFSLDCEKQELHNTYRSVIRSADSLMLVRLIKTLYLKKARVLEQKKVVPSAEKEYSETAEKMLFGEISTALQMPMDQVQGYFTACM